MTNQGKTKGRLEKIVDIGNAVFWVGATLAASAAIVCAGRAYDGYRALTGPYSPNLAYK